MRPERFLEAAQQWATENPSCEAHQRSVISRAYYASFHSCSELAGKLGIEAFGATHERLIVCLKNHADKEIKKLGNQLADLKSMRVSADYRLSDPILPKNPKLSLAKAKSIVAACDQKLGRKVGT